MSDTLPPELETEWIEQENIDAFARQIGLKPAHVNMLALVMAERLHEYGLCIHTTESRFEGKKKLTRKVETDSFLTLNLGALPRIKEIGAKRLEFLKTYQAWLRKASTP